tara:strand:- start:1624 stop:2334 length:711 start_codon:yes stop_codon:yes gene_type:complete
MNNETFLRHITHQKKHWWFQARKQIIFNLIKQIKFQKKINILDFGAGSGVNTEMLTHFGAVDVFEKNKVALKNLKQKLRIKNSYSKFNMKKNYYDFILLADVIEHIKKPRQTLNILRKLLKKNGLILITVPAYQFLYSKKDISLGHYRRYSKSSLANEIKNFKIKKVSYFNTFLFPIIAIMTLWNKFFKIDYIKNVEKTPNFLINKFLYSIFYFEKYFLKFFNFPFGISIYALIKK